MSALPLRVDVNLSQEQVERALSIETSIVISRPITGVCIDSRCLKEGDLFIALKAARDGHEFLENAMQKGASAAIVDRETSFANAWVVPDTLKALSDLAQAFRQNWGKTVIGISGSNGKTTTKEFTQTLLGAGAFKSPGTWNNHLGIPLSLFMLRPQHEFAVLEMGINNFGELSSYCKVSKPNIGVLTTIGYSHLMNLHNLEGVAKAKFELFEALPEEGTAVVLIDDPFIEKKAKGLKCKKVHVSIQKEADVCIKKSSIVDQFDITYGKESFSSSLVFTQDHNLSNLVCALGVAYACGIKLDKIQERIPDLYLFGMRMLEKKSIQGATIVLDCYNANPTSMEAGFKSIAQKEGRKIALLADMLELGEQSSKLHMEMGKKLQLYGFSKLFVLGQFAKDYIQGALSSGFDEDAIVFLQDRSSVSQKISTHLSEGDILYVKGSRGMKLEELITPILAGE